MNYPIIFTKEQLNVLNGFSPDPLVYDHYCHNDLFRAFDLFAEALHKVLSHYLCYILGFRGSNILLIRSQDKLSLNFYGDVCNLFSGLKYIKQPEITDFWKVFDIEKRDCCKDVSIFGNSFYAKVVGYNGMNWLYSCVRHIYSDKAIQYLLSGIRQMNRFHKIWDFDIVEQGNVLFIKGAGL